MRQILAFMWNNARQENFNFYFLTVFRWYQKKFCLKGALGTRL